MFFDGLKWNLENKEDFLDGLYDKYKDFLEEQYNKICENNKKLKDKFISFKKFLESQENDTISMEDNKIKYDKSVRTNQIKKLELLLYNNKNKIKKI